MVFILTHEVRGDKETGDDEEHIDTDKTTGELLRPHVIGDDERDGERTQGLYLEEGVAGPSSRHCLATLV